MPSAGFEPTIPATMRPQTYALVRAATGIGDSVKTRNYEVLLCITRLGSSPQKNEPRTLDIPLVFPRNETGALKFWPPDEV
jgi:hypothetical protein